MSDVPPPEVLAELRAALTSQDDTNWGWRSQNALWVILHHWEKEADRG
jgi:hypothetical protein